MSVFALPLSRILLSLVFIFTGYAKVVGFPGVQDMAKWKDAVSKMMIPGTTNPLPNAELLAQIAAYGELVGGIMLLLGILSRVSAFGLLAFTIVASVLGHAFWASMGDPALAAQTFGNIIQFLKNMGIVGGLLLIVVAGGGALSIDAMFRRNG